MDITFDFSKAGGILDAGEGQKTTERPAAVPTDFAIPMAKNANSSLSDADEVASKHSDSTTVTVAQPVSVTDKSVAESPAATTLLPKQLEGSPKPEPQPQAQQSPTGHIAAGNQQAQVAMQQQMMAQQQAQQQQQAMMQQQQQAAMMQQQQAAMQQMAMQQQAAMMQQQQQQAMMMMQPQQPMMMMQPTQMGYVPVAMAPTQQMMYYPQQHGMVAHPQQQMMMMQPQPGAMYTGMMR